MPQKSETTAGSVWTRPTRARSGQPTLSREQIVRAAIELLDAEGPAGLSMRRLGTKLGAGATSVYWHVTNKDELLELALDEVMAEVYVPEAGDTSWRIAASICAAGMRTMLLRHPWAIGLLGARPAIGPNSMRISDRTIAVMTGAGFSGADLGYAISLLMSHSIGAATTVSSVVSTTRQAGVPVREMLQEWKPHIDRIAADHPDYQRWANDTGVSNMDPEQAWNDAFRFGLDRLLDGLEMWLAQRKDSPETGPDRLPQS